ncbi:MAG: hypothetical protein EOP83_15825 [Verrucomicrobiaceae bacterium]|nr:MAG: hypothetical protein EOP83_15825 [Verrucomicrobiaceae bacterium]
MTDFWVWNNKLEGRRQPLGETRLEQTKAKFWPYQIDGDSFYTPLGWEQREWCREQFGPEGNIVYNEDGTPYDPKKLAKSYINNKLIFHTDRPWIVTVKGRFSFTHQRDATAFKLRWM